MRPDTELLKARLLFDGGYYQKALKALSDVNTDRFKNDRDKVEYQYRLGRIHDELGRDDEALQDYQRTINAGKSLKYYYAATAAVNMGKIYLKKKNSAKAKAYFNLAINMKNHEYENSIEAQAKDGLRHLSD